MTEQGPDKRAAADIEFERSSTTSAQPRGLPVPLAKTNAHTATAPVSLLTASRSVKSRPRRQASVDRPGRARSRGRKRSPSELVVATLVGLNDASLPLVRHTLDPTGRVMLARSTVALDSKHVGREVVIAFESGDIERPIVLGILWRPDERFRAEAAVAQTTVNQPFIQANMDGDRLVLTAQNEIVLRCGEASLTLTRGGKVVLRGAYVLSHSSGVNRIRGGSVQIN